MRPERGMVKPIVPARFFVVLALFLLAIGSVWGGQAESRSPAKKVSRFESDFSAGKVSEGYPGLLKSIWWYPLPKIFAMGISLDFIGRAMPFMLNTSLNLPLPVVVPFVCAGVGTNVSRGVVTELGGGLKLRVWRTVGFIVEYRRYTRRGDAYYDPPDVKRVGFNYVGGGVAYIF